MIITFFVSLVFAHITQHVELSWSGTETRAPLQWKNSLNKWTAREGLSCEAFFFFFFLKTIIFLNSQI